MQTNGVASSPRTWGWTGCQTREERDWELFPTHVGVDPRPHAHPRSRQTLPHARGGGPRKPRRAAPRSGSSPRTWGWTGARLGTGADPRLFPTHVGVDPYRLLVANTPSALPHARGGGPAGDPRFDLRWDSSPRTWGWTPTSTGAGRPARLFPTHVGVDRTSSEQPDNVFPLPHARGGGPNIPVGTVPAEASSPRTWGWTEYTEGALEGLRLFPTHVGVDPVADGNPNSERALPHARGGGPVLRAARAAWALSSPRTWGWTEELPELVYQFQLFPTHVGVDP